MSRTRRLKLGFIPANRGFFSSRLAQQMRDEVVRVVAGMGIDIVAPTAQQTKVGCVENREEAELCAKLFRDAEVDGILIGAVNFGDEQGAAWTVKQARLDVPILIFGCQEEETLTPRTSRRDSFCGLLSIGEALRQIGAKYSIAQRPIVWPSDEAFKADIDWFARVCRVVNGIRRARYGQIGARPDAFWTCRYDEKQLQRLGPTTVTLDLSEAIAGASRMSDDDADVRAVLKGIREYADTSSLLDLSMLKSAKFELFLRQWAKANALDALAVQCWTSIQQNFGICSCTSMSRLGDEGVAAACEADILGTLSMHALLLASDSPAALADWNNLHNEDDELANIWHCGVFPKSFAGAGSDVKLGAHPIIVDSGAATQEQAQGIVEFVAAASPVTLFRVTQDGEGRWKMVVAEGAFEDNPAATFGSYGWCRIPHLQSLYRNVLLAHFPHHVAVTQGNVGNVLWEAFGNYLDFDVHHAEQASPGAFSRALPFERVAATGKPLAAALAV